MYRFRLMSVCRSPFATFVDVELKITCFSFTMLSAACGLVTERLFRHQRSFSSARKHNVTIADQSVSIVNPA